MFKIYSSSPNSTNAVLADVAGKSHDTVVLGFDEKGNVVFLKSYDYSKQKDEAQSDLKLVIDDGMGWRISAISHLTLSDIYSEALDFVKEVAKDDYLCDKLDMCNLNPKNLLEGKEWRIEDDE